MDIIGWILTAILAAFFALAGISKLVTPRAKLLEDPRMNWVNDFTSAQVKTIAAIEVVGVVGLVIPWLVNIAPVLSSIASLGLAGVMIGAAIVNARRHDTKALPITIVMFSLAIIVAVIRFTQL